MSFGTCAFTLTVFTSIWRILYVHNCTCIHTRSWSHHCGVHGSIPGLVLNWVVPLTTPLLHILYYFFCSMFFYPLLCLLCFCSFFMQRVWGLCHCDVTQKVALRNFQSFLCQLHYPNFCNTTQGCFQCGEESSAQNDQRRVCCKDLQHTPPYCQRYFILLLVVYSWKTR